MKKLAAGFVLVLLWFVFSPPPPVRAEPSNPPDPSHQAAADSVLADLPAAEDGTTWRIVWHGTAEGDSDTTEGERRTVRNRVLTMEGTGIARWSDAKPGWETTSFAWTVTDDLKEEQTYACGKSTLHQFIVDPHREPLWVRDFLQPSTGYVDPDGNRSMHLWFVHSNAGHPTFPYRRDSRTDYYCNPPGTDFLSYTSNRDSYGYIFWWHHAQLNPDWGNEPLLHCNPAGSHCWRTNEFWKPYETPPMRVSVTIHAYRLPDSPDIDQALELSEKSVFLPGVPLTNRVDGHLDCDKSSTCAATRTVRSGQGSSSEKIGPAPTGNYPKELQIGSLPPGRTTIVAQANSPIPRPPDSKLVQVAAKLPTWAADVAAIIAHKQGDYASYIWTAKFPQPPIKRVAMPVPESVPFCKGKREAGVEVPQGGLKTEARSTGEVSLEGSIAGGIFLCDSTLSLEFAGRGKGKLDPVGVHDVTGEMDVKLTGKISAKTPLVKAIPQTKVVIESIEVFSPAIAEFLSDAAVASIEVSANTAATFKISDKSGEIAMDLAKITPAVGFKGKVALKMPEGMTSPQKNKKPTMETSLSVIVDLKPQFKTPPLEFEKLGFEGKLTFEAVAYHLGYSASVGFICTFQANKPTNCIITGSAREQERFAQWILQNRDYLARSDYARWTSPEVTPAAVDAGPTDIQLVANVYPQAGPTLALSGSRRLLVWSHDRADLPALSAQELAWSTSSGSGQPWQPSALATDDSLADFNGDLLLLTGNSGLALWERFDAADPGDFNADPLAYLSHVQIAASRWNGSVWSAPQQLSAGGTLNHSPSLLAVSGGALALWIGNSANQLGGDTVKPDRLYSARFSSATNTWISPTLVLTDVAGLLGYAAASNGSKTALVYAQDRDNDFATRDDREIFYILWANNGWGVPVQLTDNSLLDESPLLALASDGTPYLVWNQGEGLRFLKGSWDTALAGDIPLPQAVQAANLALTRGPNDRLALTWQEQTPVDTRIGYTIYEQEAGLWGLGATHTPPITGTVYGPSSEAKYISSVLDGTRLLLAYQMGYIEPMTVTEDGLTISNYPTVTHYSLRYAEIPLALNLAVAAEEIEVSPLDARPGQMVTVTVVVRNRGELASPPTSVEVHSERSPYLLASSPLPALAASASMTVVLSFVQPDGEVGPVTVQIDPDYGVWGESNRADNEAPVITPPLVTALSTQDSVLGPQIAALFRQQGILQGGYGFTVSLRLDDPSGPEVGALDVGFGSPALEEVVTATTTLSPTLLGPGRHLIYWLVGDGYAAPDDVDGAAIVTGADVIADLVLDPYDITIGAPLGATTPITGLVRNRGNWPNDPTELRVYDRFPDNPGAQVLAVLPIPAVAPGETVTISGGLTTTPLPDALYLEIDPAHSNEESNRANNLIVVGQIGGESVAPPDERVYIPWVAR